MSSVVDTLVEMGFSKEKAELAASRTGSNDVQAVMDWILSHDDESESTSAPPANLPEGSQGEPAETSPSNDEKNESEAQVKSIKCEQCQKLFKNQDEVEYHALKSGHEQFSESTEEKKALTEEEKKDQLAKIEAKLKQRRLEREAREKQEALDKERNRIKQGKEMLEAKKKYDEIEMQKLIQQRRREKEEERLAKERVKKQIEEDKLARQRKFSGQPVEVPVPPQPVLSTVQKPVVAATYSEVQLQIRLTNGTALTQSFGVKEPLSAVRLYVEMNRKDDNGPFSLMTNCPKRVFGPEDYSIPLESLGLGPRAILIVSKT